MSEGGRSSLQLGRCVTEKYNRANWTLGKVPAAIPGPNLLVFCNSEHVRTAERPVFAVSPPALWGVPGAEGGWDSSAS